MKKPRRPKPIHADPLRARVVRGPREDGRWYWRAGRFDGCGREETVWCGWASVEEAQQRLGAKVAAGEISRPTTPTRRGEVTIRDLLETWAATQQERSDLAPASIGCYLVSGRRMVADELASVPLAETTRSTVERYRDRQLKAGRAASTVRLDLTILGTAWRWALDERWVVRPLPRVRVHARPGRLRYTPSRAELSALAAELEGWRQVAVWLLSATGCRVGEIERLQWDQVDLDQARITVRGKTGERTIPLGSIIVGRLREWRLRQPGAAVWPVSGAGEMIRSALRRACRSLRIAHTTPHGIRRAAVDALYQSGADIGAASEIAGHSPSTALRHYRRASEADRRRAIERAALDVDVVEDGADQGRLSQLPVTTGKSRGST